VTMSDGSPFTGAVGFGAPYNDAGGAFAISGNNINRKSIRSRSRSEYDDSDRSNRTQGNYKCRLMISISCSAKIVSEAAGGRV